MDEELTEKLSNEAVENDEIFQRLRRTLQGMIENAESALVQKVNMSARVLAEYAQQEENEGMHIPGITSKMYKALISIL